MKPNQEIRDMIEAAKKSASIFNYDIAYQIGVNDVTFCRWLRRELPEDKKDRIRAAIMKLSNEGAAQSY